MPALYQNYKLKFGGAIQKSTILVGPAAGRVGDLESKAISASNLKLKLTEDELGKRLHHRKKSVSFQASYVNIILI